MKQEFIKKWKSWWMLQKQGAELTDAFERELNAIIEQEVASKNLVKADVSGRSELLLDFVKWVNENKALYSHDKYKSIVDEYEKIKQ